MIKKPDARQRKGQFLWQKKLNKRLAKRLFFVISFGLINLVAGLTLSFYSENKFKAGSANTEVKANQGQLILNTPEQPTEKVQVPEETETKKNS